MRQRRSYAKEYKGYRR